jgi:AcrR family transcriptional regulator
VSTRPGFSTRFPGSEPPRSPVDGESDTDLAPRVRPTQKRAEDTVALILDSTAELLDEIGIHVLNTNKVAERAKVKVSTVYRYFPNKVALVVALMEQLDAEGVALFESYIEDLADPAKDWRETWGALVHDYVNSLGNRRGALAVRRSVQAMPELQRINRRSNLVLAKEIAAALQKRGVKVPASRLLTVGLLLLSSGGAIVDDPHLREVTPEIIDEMVQMHLPYLATYLD